MFRFMLKHSKQPSTKDKNKSVELCIEDDINNNHHSPLNNNRHSPLNNNRHSPLNHNNSPTNSNSNSLESSIQSLSTYDSMMQTLNDELNNVTGDTHDLMDFEDLDFFKMDCATAMAFDYEMNYTMKQLKHIAGYYGIKYKARKMDAIHDIVVYETDAANGDAVIRRKRLFHYMDALKNDEYFKSFVMM